ncbi:MAG: O-antigen ligase family protein, partial [Candidatus Coproplasma sp.]
PFITAVVVVGCYYLAWDMVTIWYMALCGIAVLLLLKDVTPLISLFLFMNIMISWKNSPSEVAGNSDYYFQPTVLVQLGILIGAYAAVAIFKVILSIKNKQLKPTPTLWGLCAFALAMILNGIFSQAYNAMNAVYGLFMAFFFLVIFALGSGNIKVEKSTFEKIAWAFIALSLCLILELMVAYLTYDGLFVDGRVDRVKLMFGWGVYNTMGMLLTISLPSAAYLAIRHKYGWIFTAYLMVLLACAYLTLSRQAILCGSVVFFLCVIAIFVKGKNEVAHGGIMLAGMIVAIILTKQYSDVINQTLESLSDNFFSGSGRIDLYKLGFSYFMEKPLFGVGFYVPVEQDPGFTGLDIIPRMYHNTVIQLLATGGVVAFATYVIHRAHTVISYAKNPTFERTYVALTIAALLMLNLLDNHLFYILPTLVYSMLVAVLVNSENAKTD